MKTAPSSSDELIDVRTLNDPGEWILACAVWQKLFSSGVVDLSKHNEAAHRPYNTNRISTERMKKFTDAFLLARLRGHA